MKVYDIIKQSAQKWPDSPAVYDERGVLTFSGLEREVEALKEKLVAQGVSKGMGLGVMAKNSRDFIIGIFAGLGTCATVMPISHHLPRPEIDLIINEAKLHAIIDDGSGIAPIISDDSTYIKEFRFAWSGTGIDHKFVPHVENPAFIRFTSGTTGKSKGVIISHNSVMERIEAANRALGLRNGDVVVWVLPMAYHFIVSIVLYLRFGAAIALCENFFAKTIMDCANKYNGTLLYASPISFRLLANDTTDADFKTLKMAISTSTAVSIDICRAFYDRFGIGVTQAYGVIEVGLPIINTRDNEPRPDAVGHALPDYEVEILGDDGAILQCGDIGHLAMRGPGMFDGYLTPPQTRDDILNHGWFMTGDLASKTPDGLIKIEGRKKSMINVSGNKVFPEEVEALLNAHPMVKISRVMGGVHHMIGEIVEAEVVLNDGHRVTARELIDFCREKLSAYKLPQRIRFVDSIEMTGSGKVARL